MLSFLLEILKFITVNVHAHSFFRCQFAEYTTPLNRPLPFSTVDTY